jgi:ATP-dependent DNA ligase
MNSEMGHELKFDGYRALGLMTGGRLQILSRKGKNFTRRFASIAKALEKLPAKTSRLKTAVHTINRPDRPPLFYRPLIFY